MKKYRVQRGAVIFFCGLFAFLQVFYYPILRVCFPGFLKEQKTLADGISIAVTIGLAVSIYVFVTMILKANQRLWTLSQQKRDCAYVKVSNLTGEALTAESLMQSVRERSRKEGWGQLEEVEFCGNEFAFLLVKGTACVYLDKAETLTAEQLKASQDAILQNVEALGYRKRQESLLCYCCETAQEAARSAAKVCLRRGKTALYSVVLEASTGRAYCLLTDKKGKIQDNVCQKNLAKLILGYPGGAVPESARSQEKNPDAAQAKREIDEFDLISFWKSTR